MRAEVLERLPEAAGRFGTPLYAYDWASVRARHARLSAAFPGARLLYAVKANPNLGLIRRMRERLGVGFEVVSGGELERALRAGAAGSALVLNGPGKLDGDYSRAAEVGATLVVDSPGEVARAGRLARGARALVRVNPGLKVSTHDHLATGDATSKFGVRLDEATATVRALEAAGLEVAGLHVHIGSHLHDPRDYEAALAAVASLAREVGPRPVLDMGGGFGLDLDPAPLARLAADAAAAFGAELWIEPGRWLVAEAGALVTRVLEAKRTGRAYLVCDAGMTELLRPMLYGARHPVVALGAGGPPETWDVAGPACESGDVLARDVSLPSPRPGALLAVLEAGAYGASMASSYLTRPRPAEALLEDDGTWVPLRRRDTLGELLAAELA